MGYSLDMLSRPIVGIAQSASGFNNCHRYVPELVEAVKRGVLKAGGLPLDFPTISLGEVFLSPTSLMFRNLMAMDVEEMIRAQPMDAVVLIGGCDKTVPAQLMGAVSADLPAIQLVTGPMMAMPCRGERLGACTDCRRFWGKYRAGEVSDDGDRRDRRQPRHDGRHLRGHGHGQHHGLHRRSAWHELCRILRPFPLCTRIACARRRRPAFARCDDQRRRAATVRNRDGRNRWRTRCACCWPSAVRPTRSSISPRSPGARGVPISLEQLNRLSDETPVLVDLKPTGSHYMQDLHAAGGMSALLLELKDLLHLDCMTVTGETLGERLAAPRALRRSQRDAFT